MKVWVIIGNILWFICVGLWLGVFLLSMGLLMMLVGLAEHNFIGIHGEKCIRAAGKVLFPFKLKEKE
jgi:hypothetical protein